MAAWRNFSAEDRGEILRAYAQVAAQQNIAASERAFSAVATRRIVAPGNPPVNERRVSYPVTQQETSQQTGPASQSFVQQPQPQEQYFHSQSATLLHTPQHPSQQSAPTDLSSRVPQQPFPQSLPTIQGQQLGHGFQRRELPQPPGQARVAAPSRIHEAVQQPPRFAEPMGHQQAMFQDQPMFEYETFDAVQPQRAFSPPFIGSGAIAHPQPSRPGAVMPPADEFMMDADGSMILPFCEDTVSTIDLSMVPTHFQPRPRTWEWRKALAKAK